MLYNLTYTMYQPLQNPITQPQKNTLYINQLRQLALHFSSIENDSIRQKTVNFVEHISQKNEEQAKLLLDDKSWLEPICDPNDENFRYILAFARRIRSIDSIGLKDKMMEVIEMIGE